MHDRCSLYNTRVTFDVTSKAFIIDSYAPFNHPHVIAIDRQLYKLQTLLVLNVNDKHYALKKKKGQKATYKTTHIYKLHGI